MDKVDLSINAATTERHFHARDSLKLDFALLRWHQRAGIDGRRRSRIQPYMLHVRLPLVHFRVWTQIIRPVSGVVVFLFSSNSEETGPSGYGFLEITWTGSL